MRPNPQFPMDLVTFTEKSLMENFIFCAVKIKDDSVIASCSKSCLFQLIYYYKKC